MIFFIGILYVVGTFAFTFAETSTFVMSRTLDNKRLYEWVTFHGIWIGQTCKFSGASKTFNLRII